MYVLFFSLSRFVFLPDCRLPGFIAAYAHVSAYLCRLSTDAVAVCGLAAAHMCDANAVPIADCCLLSLPCHCSPSSYVCGRLCACGYNNTHKQTRRTTTVWRPPNIKPHYKTTVNAETKEQFITHCRKIQQQIAATTPHSIHNKHSGNQLIFNQIQTQ